MSSTFEVTIEDVVAVHPHHNAEKLEIIQLRDCGYTIISQKGTYTVGDRCVLFMPDSVFPDEMVKALELDYLYKGNRVKTVKLRGVISQALILTLSTIRNYLITYKDMLPLDVELELSHPTRPLAQILGIEKYEAPEPTDENSTGALPIPRYDIEGVEKYPNHFMKLVNKHVVITEKLEGTNLAWHLNEDDTATACKRSSSVGEESMYHKIAIERGWDKFARYIKSVLGVQTVSIRGELLGEAVQGNIYSMKGKGAMVFDVMVNGEYVDYVFLRYLAASYNDAMTQNAIVNHSEPTYIHLVPVVFNGVLKDFAATPSDFKEKSNGKSLLGECMREGLVVKPILEIEENHFRMQLKQHSPEYLASKK